MKTVAIIQARMGSTRLPGKSVMPLAGKPLIWHVVERVKKAALIDEVVLAIPEEPNATEIINAVFDVPVLIFGRADDLVWRYNVAADMAQADVVVRVPGDNPCVEPSEIDRIIALSRTIKVDKLLVSNLDRNILNNGYPGGLGAEVYSREFLTWLDNNIQVREWREHPHKWAFDTDRVITCFWPYGPQSRSDLHFDVNTIEDFRYIERIYNFLYPYVTISNILEFLDSNYWRPNNGRQ